jgi:hypothetical protein
MDKFSQSKRDIEHDFESIESAVLETPRGRWFLAEYARRAHQSENEFLLLSIRRLENLLNQKATSPEAHDILMSCAKVLDIVESITQTVAIDHHALNPADHPLRGISLEAGDITTEISLAADMIRDLAKRGATVLFSTHVMAHAERLCENVVMLTKGRKVFEGTLRQARERAPRYLELEGVLNREQVTGLPGVSEVIDGGSGEEGTHRWRLRFLPGVTPNEALKTVLVGGLDVRRFEAHEPTLHDAFIVLTNGGEQA